MFVLWEFVYFASRVVIGDIMTPSSWSNKSLILGKGYLFFTMTLFNFLQSMHSLKLPCFFFINKTEVPQSDVLGQIKLLSIKFYSWTFNSFNSIGTILEGGIEIGSIPGMTSMQNSISFSNGTLGNSLGNMSRNSWITSKFSNFYSNWSTSLTYAK